MRIPLDIKIGWTLIGVNITMAAVTASIGEWSYMILHVAITALLIGAVITAERREK